MNRSIQHAFEPQEVMTYLDGELEPRRAAALAAHLEHCDECRALVAQLRLLSERLLDFHVDPPTKSMDARILDALGSAETTTAKNVKTEKPRRWRLGLASPYTWALAGVLLVALVVGFGIPFLQRSRERAYSSDFDLSEAYIARTQSAPAAAAAPVSSAPTAGEGALGKLEAPQPTGPLIAQTASLTIIANNYDEASGSLGRLAASEGGYVQKLSAQAAAGAPREVSATLRVPAKQLDGFLTELRKLGRVEQESQANDEVTDQYVDLQARLKSARASEQRMLELLATRTGKLEDVLDAERELARIRQEIESMEGQRVLLAHRVDYATVETQLREEYRKQLGAERPSTTTSIRNAAVEGFGNLEDGVIGLLLFLLAYGPAILFWLAILALPAWFAWRRFRPRSSVGR